MPDLPGERQGGARLRPALRPRRLLRGRARSHKHRTRAEGNTLSVGAGMPAKRPFCNTATPA
ncbi:hypothetical protein C1X72_01625 [Pseudomonas sp. FW306-2-2C-D06B]|nr:hypothetical protein C1X72_01625 [Pseudomonas sp. FW306-2-2C-D06B]